MPNFHQHARTMREPATYTHGLLPIWLCVRVHCVNATLRYRSVQLAKSCNEDITGPISQLDSNYKHICLGKLQREQMFSSRIHSLFQYSNSICIFNNKKQATNQQKLWKWNKRKLRKYVKKLTKRQYVCKQLFIHMSAHTYAS